MWNQQIKDTKNNSHIELKERKKKDLDSTHWLIFYFDINKLQYILCKTIIIHKQKKNNNDLWLCLGMDADKWKLVQIVSFYIYQAIFY